MKIDFFLISFQIDLEVLFTMTDDDLKRIGIESEVDRDTILKFKNIFFV